HMALSEYRPILANRPPSQSFSSMADVKLTLIPIIFIVLRIWSTVRFILLLADSPVRQNPVPSALAYALRSVAAALNVEQRRSFQTVPHRGTRRDRTHPLREKKKKKTPVECRQTDDASLCDE
ncbi:hypothetical protein XENOCAPTIV_003347, partial [Xenoophorus captivus]